MILKEIRRFLPGDRLGVCTAGCDGHGLLVCFWYDKEFITKTGTVRAVADRRTDSLVLSGRTDQRNECTAGIQLSGQKVVFRIDILPMVKVVSAVFVHLFFILVALILYTAMGCYPTVYTIQVIYYTFCIFVLVLGITYMTSSVVVFFVT